jgi:hypothetical protein
MEIRQSGFSLVWDCGPAYRLMRSSDLLDPAAWMTVARDAGAAWNLRLMTSFVVRPLWTNAAYRIGCDGIDIDNLWRGLGRRYAADSFVPKT